jgi:hypothetical protein
MKFNALVFSSLIAISTSAFAEGNLDCSSFSLSECYKLTPIEQVQTQCSDPDCNAMRFVDYPYRLIEEFVVLCKSPSGDTLKSEKFTRSKIQIKHFEVKSYQGDEALLNIVNGFINSRLPLQCQ